MARTNVVDKALKFGQSVFTSALRRRGVGNENSSSFMQDYSPLWVNYFNKKEYQYIYELNPVLKGIIDTKARASSNVVRLVKELKTGDILDTNTTNKDAQRIYKLIKKPNPFQSEFEFFNQRKVNHEIFGNSYTYGMTPEGISTVNFRTLQNLINLPSQYTKAIHTGAVFDQLNIKGIVDKYVVQVGIIKKEIEPEFILHRNDVNISGFVGSMTHTELGVTNGRSRLQSLMMPLSNIQRAFESRNVIITRRGALGIFTSDMKDAGATYPLTDEEHEKAQAALGKYGTLSDQDMFVLTRVPLKYQHITQSVKELGLFEEIATDTMLVATSFGVPEILVKLYIKGATFENQQSSVRRMYNETLIPEGNDDNEAINGFLKTRDFGYEIINSYDHVDALQENKKEEADRRKINYEVGFGLFKADAITLNEWLKMVDMPPVKHGEIRITNMTPDQVALLLGQININADTEPANEPAVTE